MDSRDGSVTSTFKFISYKVDEFSFQMEKSFAVLDNMNTVDSSMWELSVLVRGPVFFEERNQYLSGVKCVLGLKPNKKKLDFCPVQLSASISGLFETEGRFPQATETALIKLQMPTILLPYLRATITSFLANAGFGSVILPLINIAKMAEDTLKDIDVVVVSKQPAVKTSKPSD